MYFIIIFAVVVFGTVSNALKFSAPKYATRRSTLLREVPLELTGQLDSSKTWDVKFVYKGQEKVLNVREDTSILESVERVFDGIQSSCRNGVCTTCAGQVHYVLV